MSLAFPDVNVWLALSTGHVHQKPALEWWNREARTIGFCRFTQLGLLRLLTTASVMDQSPLSMGQAWKTYDQFFRDERVQFLAEPPTIEPGMRRLSASAQTSPKVWADAYLLAFAAETGGVVITFDRALARRADHGILLA
jgi:toxin-antitoxin system PIN domain toxin